MNDPAIEEARGRHATIRFDSRRCIHARACVLSLPAVFKANVEGPWIDPDAARPQDLYAVALACPSGAISVVFGDGVEGAELPPNVNIITVRENGPLAAHAELSIAGTPDGNRATLCRCGASARKPYCDNSHAKAGFSATGEPPLKQSAPLAARDGRLDVVAIPNGPLQISGNVELVSGTGHTVDRAEKLWLCRCGASKNKPYCDGTHKTVGFRG
jgi:CDGSH-type Zn-finger protein/uncharacterized Fe-S cluster protein YjdI